MNQKINRQFSSIVESTHRKMNLDGRVMPLKIPEGVLVGDVKIINEHCVKHIEHNGELIFKGINLNIAAIAIANIIALRKDFFKAKQIFQEDQKYGKWFNDCQNLMHSYRNALSKKDHDLADIFYARYQEAKSNVVSLKKTVESLTNK